MTTKKTGDMTKCVAQDGMPANLREGAPVQKGAKPTAPQNLVLPKPTAAPKTQPPATKK